MEDFFELSQIFHEAVNIRNAEQRDSFIAQRCDGRTELKVQVEELIQAFLAGSDSPFHGLQFLKKSQIQKMFSPEHGAQTISRGSSAASCLETEGDQIGPYHLKQGLGSGGFGVVFRAQQYEPIQREVAIKLIKPGMDSKEVLSRFNLERKALAVMDHPCIARIHDAGCTELGRPYFAMELVEDGQPINQYCDEEKLSIRDRVELMVKVCKGVQHAHQKGIIHRDIKPANILVSEGVPKLIDFGVAKALNLDEGADLNANTRVGQRVGTPLYMSPEQAASSNSEDVDARADIYSLGAVLFELVTGTTPLNRESLKGIDSQQIFELIRNSLTPVPSKRLIHSSTVSNVLVNRRASASVLVKQVRGELDWIITKTLESDRERRYGSAGELAADLKRYLDNEPVVAARTSQMHKFKKFASRNIATVTIATAVATLVIVSAAISILYGIRANQSAAVALKAELNERVEKEKAIEAQRREEKERQKLEVFFENFDELLDIATLLDLDLQKEKIDELIEQVIKGDQMVDGQSLSKFPRLHAQVLDGWGKALGNLAQHERRILIYAKANDLVREECQPDDRFRMDILHKHLYSKMKKVLLKAEGRQFLLSSKLKTELEPVIKDIEELVELEEQYRGEKSQLDEALEILSYCHERVGDMASARSVFDRRMQLLEHDPNASAFDRIHLMISEAFLHESREKRVEVFNKALTNIKASQSEMKTGDYESLMFHTLQFRMDALTSLGRERESFNDFQKMLELSKVINIGGDTGFEHAALLLKMGTLFIFNGRIFEAIENLEKSRRILFNFDDAKKSNFASGTLVKCNNWLSHCLFNLEQIDQAEIAMREMSQFDSGLVENIDGPALVFQRLRATLGFHKGEMEKTSALVHELATVVQGDQCPNVTIRTKATLLNRLANLLRAMGEPHSAIQLRSELLEWEGEQNKDIVYLTKSELAIDFRESENPELSRDTLESCLDYFHESSKSKTSSVSREREWFSMLQLAITNCDLGEFEKSENLLTDLLQQQLKFYGNENLQTLKVREQLARVCSAAEWSEMALKSLRSIEVAHDEIEKRLLEKWPGGWQALYVANRKFESLLNLIIEIDNSSKTDGILRELTSEILKQHSGLKQAAIPKQRKNELNLQCIRNVIKCYELQSDLDVTSKWRARIDE